jgi:hypothetical protein
MKGKTAAQLSPVRFISAIGTVLLSYVFSCIYDSTLLYDGRARNVPWATLCSSRFCRLCAFDTTLKQGALTSPSWRTMVRGLHMLGREIAMPLACTK